MRALVMAAAAGLAFAAPAWAQTDYARQVLGYLEHGMSEHAALSYAGDPSNADIVEPLELDSPYLWSVYLRAGENYRVYGACDIDCRDLDMEIYGADGRLVDRDVATDDVPYVQITPTESGRHYVRLWLYDCSDEPCFIAARVVAGGAPAPRAGDDVPPPAVVNTGEPPPAPK